jgi:hypothetical protein
VEVSIEKKSVAVYMLANLADKEVEGKDITELLAIDQHVSFLFAI